MPWRFASAGVREYRLVAQEGTAALAGTPYPDTPVWAYNGQVSGPELRAKQGERLRVIVENKLSQPTTVHWHGLRIPHDMDGVPELTQPPIMPGETFTYEFDLPDAGTFWYHPHFNSQEQVGRGLFGALIVEEPEAPQIDRDLTWVINDWLLTEKAEIEDSFGSPMALSHGGRLGNTVTLNGKDPDILAVRAGERVRIRLINTSTARIMALTFGDHDAWVVAYDGQPVKPHLPEGKRLVLGPAMRVDVIIDMTGNPGERFPVIDTYYQRQRYQLLELAYSEEAPMRETASAPPASLPDNPLLEPDLASAKRHRMVFEGGAMGRMRGARLDGEMLDSRSLFSRGKMWAVNGVVNASMVDAPILKLEQGGSHVIEMVNESSWAHPMHLHGHSFRLLSRQGEKVEYQPWMDTVLMARGERVEVALVADNPGDWPLHCHILGHQAAGMSALVRVA